LIHFYKRIKIHKSKVVCAPIPYPAIFWSLFTYATVTAVALINSLRCSVYQPSCLVDWPPSLANQIQT